MTSYILKEYFRKPKTVSRWWDPEKIESKYKNYYIKERKDVIEISKPENKLVLDVGTGKGRLAISFAKAGAKKVIANDISAEMLNITKKRALESKVLDKISFNLGDAENLPYKNESFDIVCCLQALPHFGNPHRAINEFLRVSKKGGLIIIDAIVVKEIYRFICKIYFHSLTFPLRKLLSKFFNLPKDQLIYKGTPLVKMYTKNEFLNLVKNNDLEIKCFKKYDIFGLFILRKR